ncbi:MAG TPA: hypothetical protein VFU63_04675, partial [Ktedonobacterales bacterium]|nr:hypothetical protein [Ktedonobacterales bacterium]
MAVKDNQFPAKFRQIQRQIRAIARAVLSCGGNAMMNGRHNLTSTMSREARAVQPTPQQVLNANERHRRHRLVRLVSIGILVGTGLLIPTALIPTPDIVTLVAVLTAFVGAGVGYLLNRMRFLNSAGYVVLGGMMIAVGWEIIAQSIRQGGLDLNDLRVYDLLVLPIVLSAVLVTRRGPVILAAMSIAFTIVSLIFLAKSPPLQQYWDGTYPYAIGSSYDIVIVPVVLQGLAATAAWLGADSVRRALLEAYRVEEISAAKAQIEEQQRRLQRGIAHIQQVHAAVAHGQWDARAQVESAELIPVAVSLNLLLDRLSRLTRDQEQRQRVDHAAHELAQALRRLRFGQAYTPPPYTGTPFDEVLMELDVLRSVRPEASAPPQGAMPPWSSGGGAQTGARQPIPPTPPSPPSPPSLPNRSGEMPSPSAGWPPS